MLGRFLAGREGEGNWMAPYAVDIREDADHIYVDAELPGFKKDEVEITLENQTLTISAERKPRSQAARTASRRCCRNAATAASSAASPCRRPSMSRKCDAKLQRRRPDHHARQA